MSSTAYNEKFYAMHEEGARVSARETIPVLFEFVRPTSVVDVGCGQGAWLAEFKAAGVAECLGIDGDYVDRAQLKIEPERFMARDLAEPLELDRRFDLAMCLEVAEHLPAQRAETLVGSLVRLAPVVLFSAAIPHQHGDGHVNEQWPDYWNEIFERHDYVVVDCLRRRLWSNVDIEAWYRQNLLLFVERARLGDYPRLQAALDTAGADPPLSFVHPGVYLENHRTMRAQVREARSMVMRLSFRLREIALAVFPDWTQPRDTLQAQLQALLAAMAVHADHAQMALLIYAPGPQIGALSDFVRELIARMPAEVGGRFAEGPEVSGVSDSFPPENWKSLLDCLQWRVTLPREDGRAIATAGAEALASVSVAQIEAGQSLGGT